VFPIFQIPVFLSFPYIFHSNKQVHFGGFCTKRTCFFIPSASAPQHWDAMFSAPTALPAAAAAAQRSVISAACQRLGASLPPALLHSPFSSPPNPITSPPSNSLILNRPNTFPPLTQFVIDIQHAFQSPLTRSPDPLRAMSPTPRPSTPTPSSITGRPGPAVPGDEGSSRRSRN